MRGGCRFTRRKRGKIEIKKRASIPIQLEWNWRCPIARSVAGATAITFQRGLNLNVIPDGPTQGRVVASAPFAIKISKNEVAREQYGAVVAPSQLETIAAPALPRSNQIDATLFDKGRNDTYGELL
jgi:hypothetical protein